MKILYHHRTASKDGMDVHIQSMVEAFRRRGHIVRVVGPEAHEASDFGSERSLVSAIRARLPKAIGEGLELAYNLHARRRLAEAIDQFEPDVLYERYNLFLSAGVTLAKARGLPFVVEVNSPLAEEREATGGLALRDKARAMEREVWTKADYVLPVTQVLGDRLIERGVEPERIHIIPNGVDLDQFSPGQPDQQVLRQALGLGDNLVLGFTGFVREWHGLDRVLTVLGGTLLAGNIHFLILGDGPAVPGLKALAKTLGIEDRVHFKGLVSREDMPRYASLFDIALQPRVVPYASPLKLFEYLALGKAVLAPRLPNIEEVLTDGQNALLFDDNDVNAFAEGIYRLVTDPVLRTQLGHNARASVVDRDLTWDGNAARIEALLEGEGPSETEGAQPRRLLAS
ncbi:MAG: glycosyltransferase family 4 protein [Pseudomonadota bacterium]